MRSGLILRDGEQRVYSTAADSAIQHVVVLSTLKTGAPAICFRTYRITRGGVQFCTREGATLTVTEFAQVLHRLRDLSASIPELQELKLGEGSGVS